MVRLILPALLVTGICGAQILPPETDAAVVAILEQPRIDDQGVVLRTSGQLKVVRALSGPLQEGDRLALQWEFRAMPNEPREPEKRLPSGQGIWLLKRNGGEWQPQPFLQDRTSMFAGGVVFPLPPEPMPPQYLAPPGASWQRAAAHEVRWAMEWLAQKHGEKLNPERRVLPSGGVALTSTGPQRLFLVAAEFLAFLPPDHTQQTYQALAESAYPNARMVGLVGLLRAAVPGSALEIERDWSALAPTVEAGRLLSVGLPLARLPLEDRLALARLAISETAPPFLEESVASQLGHSGSDVVLPFLAVMLESPDPSVRSSALMSVCNLLRRTIDEPDRWCLNRLPVTDAAVEREILFFWRSRLRETRVASLRPPARYATAPARDLPEAVPLEERIQALAFTYTNTQSPHPLRGSLDERDASTLTTILESFLTADRENGAELQRQIHARRLQGLPPDRSLADAANRKRSDLQTGALEQLRRELSPAGWEQVEHHLRSMHIVRQRIPVPAP